MYVTEDVAEHVDLLDSKNANQQGQSNGYHKQGQSSSPNQQPQKNSHMQKRNDFGNSNPMDISDSDLPF